MIQNEEKKMEIMLCLLYPSSFLLIVFLWNWLSLLRKRKYGIPVKVYSYTKTGLILIICGGYIAYFFRYEDFDTSYLYKLGSFLLASCIFVVYDRVTGYRKSEINLCLDDRESIGSFWALQTYEAYYKPVLERIKDRMMAFEEEKNIQILVKKLLIIIPLSCDTESTLNEKDGAMEEFGYLSDIENDQGANMNRKFRNPVFKISSTQDIYVVAEFSCPVSALWKSRFDMKKENINYIRDCFIKTLKFLLQGSLCIIIEYDDTVQYPESLSQCILSAIQKENNTRIKID